MPCKSLRVPAHIVNIRESVWGPTTVKCLVTCVSDDHLYHDLYMVKCILRHWRNKWKWTIFFKVLSPNELFLKKQFRCNSLNELTSPVGRQKWCLYWPTDSSHLHVSEALHHSDIQESRWRLLSTFWRRPLHISNHVDSKTGILRQNVLFLTLTKLFLWHSIFIKQKIEAKEM